MALIKTIEDVKKYLAVDKNMSMTGVLPYITDAEEQYLIPLIGQALYDRVQSEVDGDDDPSAAVVKLLPRIQRPLANIAFWLYLPVGNVQIGDNGVQIVSTEHAKMAFEWQFDKVLRSFATSGMNGLEAMLSFLESNLDDFPEYAGSDARTENNALLINSGVEFSRYYGINNSRLTFVCLRPIVERIENDRVASVMGETYGELKSKLAAGTELTAKETNILRAARQALAFASIADAIPELSVEIGPAGLSVNYVSASNNIHYKSTPSADRIEKLMAHVQGLADKFFNDLADLVKPEDESSSSSNWDIDNEGKKIVFI